MGTEYETTAKERAEWITKIGRAWGMSSADDVGRIIRDLDRALAERDRLKALLQEAADAIPDWLTGVHADLLERIRAALSPTEEPRP